MEIAKNEGGMNMEHEEMKDVIKMVNRQHYLYRNNAMEPKLETPKKIYTGSTKQRKQATKQAHIPNYKKKIAALFLTGLTLSGIVSFAHTKNNQDTYLPLGNSVMQQIADAMEHPESSQLDDIFTFTQRNDLEEMKEFENNIARYSMYTSQKQLSSFEKQNLKECKKQIQDYYNQNTSIVNSTMLSFVKVAIADTYTSTHKFTLPDGRQIPDILSARDIRFSNATEGNYQAANINGAPANFKNAPEIYEAVHAIVSLQNGNTDIRSIVDAYAKCAKVLDTKLSIRKENNCYTISSNREQEKTLGEER